MHPFFTAALTLLALGWTASPAGAVGSVRVETGISWHDNVTNAERPEDLLAAFQAHADVGTTVSRSVVAGHRLRGGAALRLNAWPRFDGLDSASPSVFAGWDFKPGLGPNRPVLAVDTEGEARVAREHDRGGLGGAAAVAVRQRLGTAWQVTAGHEWRRFDARGPAFARTGREWFGRVEWVPSDTWVFTAELRSRFGDVVSYSQPPRPDLEAIGKPITRVDTFEQEVPWIAYYFEARTRTVAVEAGRTVGRHRLVLRHEENRTEHAGPGYRNRVTGLRFVASF